jgi:excisionase family DNA binding protein
LAAKKWSPVARLRIIVLVARLRVGTAEMQRRVMIFEELFPSGPRTDLTIRYPRTDQLRIAEPAQEKMAYGVREAAKTLNVSERTVWSLVKTGELRSVIRAGRRLITRQNIEAFLEGDNERRI